MSKFIEFYIIDVWFIWRNCLMEENMCGLFVYWFGKLFEERKYVWKIVWLKEICVVYLDKIVCGFVYWFVYCLNLRYLFSYLLGDFEEE